MIRGMNAESALAALEFTNKRASVFLSKVLRAAINSAEQDEAERDTLYVKHCRIDEGPTWKRWQPKDRGRAHPIKKRTSHIKVELETELLHAQER
jgi:large subunit ribosomal protein L22